MWSNIVVWDKDVKEKDLFELTELDRQLIEAKIKSMKPAEVKVDGEGR